MSAQAEEMEDMVEDLVVLVEGKNGEKKITAAMGSIQKPEQTKPVQSAADQDAISHHEIKTDEVLPLEDEDFKDF